MVDDWSMSSGLQCLWVCMCARKCVHADASVLHLLHMLHMRHMLHMLHMLHKLHMQHMLHKLHLLHMRTCAQAFTSQCLSNL